MRRLPWAAEIERKPKPAQPEDADVFARLPETLELEQCARFETYLAELRAVRDSGMTFQQWQRMAPADMPSEIGVVYVLVSASPG
jgi:hypothetical protein